MDYDQFPAAVGEALRGLAAHYDCAEVGNRGANGHLIFGQNRVSKAHVAIKFYFGEPGVKQHDEPQLLASLAAPNILPILDARRIADGWAYFITPRCFDGDIDDLLGTGPSVHRAVDVALGVCAGVSAIHRMRMVHRDLKPANIVLTSGAARIADFGSVRALESGGQDVGASRHSILYCPPESFSTNRYSVRGDVYQVGLLVYRLLGGSMSYNGVDYLNSAEKVKYGRLAEGFERSRVIDGAVRRRSEAGTLVDFGSLPGWIDIGARRAVRRMIAPSPNDRFGSLADIAAELTAIRSRTPNWRWNGKVAEATTRKSSFEVRPVDDKTYALFRDNGSGFRRVPKVEIGPMTKVARNVKP